MLNPTELILIGGFSEIFDLCARCDVKILGVVDSIPDVVKGYDIPYLGTDIDFLAKDYSIDIPLFATPDLPAVRKKIHLRYQPLGFRFASLVDPSAIVSPTATIGQGCMVQAHCLVSANACLGEMVRLNVGAKVFHDVSVADFSTLAPNATALGHVSVSDSVYLGASCTILPFKRLGAGSTIGAGAVVTQDVPAGLTVAGVPAKPLKNEIS
jgi:sugar O-acyltransferase (sialic acid O-acetyltransferase NeuD family)